MSGSDSPYTLHPESVAFIKLGEKAKPWHEYRDISELRSEQAKTQHLLTGEVDYAGVREEISIPSAHVEEGIPAFLYKPETAGPDPAILVFFHDGGWVLGSKDRLDVVCKIISNGAKCIIVNVGYRLAPEHRFPACFDDADAATEWVIKNKTTLGGTEKSKVGVAGTSAGANLAASVCHDVKGIDFQILVYPALFAKYDYSWKSAVECYHGPVLDRKKMDWFYDNCLSCKEDARNPRYCPYLQKNFDHLPPTLFLVSQIDFIRDDSFEYEKLLREAGVHTELELYEGAVHGFYNYPAVFPTLAKASHHRTIEFIKKFQTST